MNGNPVTQPDPRYFQSRPSATVPPNNAAASTFSNLGPNNTATADRDPGQHPDLPRVSTRPRAGAATTPPSPARRRSRSTRPTARPPGWIRTSRWPTRSIQAYRIAASRTSRSRRSTRSSPPTRPAAASASSASRASTSCNSTSRSTASPEGTDVVAPATPPTPTRNLRASASGLAVPARHRHARDDRQLRQARPARADPQPGDVRRRDRRRDHDDRLADPGRSAASRSAAVTSLVVHVQRSRSGCG